MNNEKNAIKGILNNTNFKSWNHEFYLLLKGKNYKIIY